METKPVTVLLKSVLLIDDDPVNNFINHHIIKSFNISESISFAKSGQDALCFLEKYSEENQSLPELILIDLNMPVMDGFEFVRAFRNAYGDKATGSTLAVLTTSTTPGDVEKTREMGIRYYYNKPLTKESFEELLKKEFNYRKPVKNTFGTPIIPPNEEDRLKAVGRYRIINTAAEPQFDALVEEAAKYFDVPIALVSIVDYDKVWFKANFGMKGVKFADRGVSLCSLAILRDEITVIPNAEEDPCLVANPLVHGAFGLKFYAGAPIADPEGYHIGTFCLVDKKTRAFSEGDKAKLAAFAALAMERIEARQTVAGQQPE